MTKAIVIHEYGGPDVLKWEDVEVGKPGPNEVRIKHEAIGLNFRDTYHRSGSYKIPGDKFPAVIGSDGSGFIEDIGPDVFGFSVGDRVAYGNGPMGSYSHARLMPAEFVIKLPNEISFEIASAMMVKGMTARYLLRQSYNVKSGDTILIQAAAGGVGLIMTQWAKYIGATVIGTVSKKEKADLVKSYGCDHVINYTTDDVPDQVRKLTNGVGVDVVYDGVGKATFRGSIESLRVRGYLIGYGNASGNFPEFDPLVLMNNGSLYFQRANLNHFVTNREELEIVSSEVMDLVSRGIIKIVINHRYSLKDACQAHIDLVNRKTSGSVVYIP